MIVDRAIFFLVIVFQYLLPFTNIRMMSCPMNIMNNCTHFIFNNIYSHQRYKLYNKIYNFKIVMCTNFYNLEE